MNDTILFARIGALREQLTVVEESPKWLETMPLNPKMSEDLKAGLDSTIGGAARLRKMALDKIEREFLAAEPGEEEEVARATRDAWQRYFVVQQESQEIFDECLQFLGGVAIRNEGFDRILDNQIWQVADELIRGCAQESTGDPWTSLTVPAPEEAVAKTLARMIRLRFPDWNLWTISLTASEYGHVVAEDVPGLANFIKEEVQTLVEPRLEEIVAAEVAAYTVRNDLPGEDESELRATLAKSAEDELAQFPRPPGRSAQAEIEGDDLELRIRMRVAHAASTQRERLHVLVADAFATYTMGIAYAGPALLLRFGPGRELRDAVVSDAERGEVVMAMLRRMNEQSDERPYASLIDRLHDGWASVVEYAMTTPGRCVEDEYVARFVEDLWSVFYGHLRPTARYPLDEPTEGWLSVKKARVVWPPPNLGESDGSETSLELRKLRDVLNLAWSWRLENPGADETTIRRLEKAAMAICKGIASEGRQKVDRRRGSAQRARVSGPASR